MILRNAEPGDLAAIAEILNDEIDSGTASWTETPKTADDMARWFAGRAASGFPVLVAEDGGAVLGYASYGPFRAGEGYRGTVEHSVYVARPARGRGIARLLMARLIATARAAGLSWWKSLSSTASVISICTCSTAMALSLSALPA